MSKMFVDNDYADEFFYEWMDYVLKHFKRENRDAFVNGSDIMRLVRENYNIKPLDPRRTGMLLRELFGDPISVKVNGKAAKIYLVAINKH